MKVGMCKSGRPLIALYRLNKQYISMSSLDEEAVVSEASVNYIAH